MLRRRPLGIERALSAQRKLAEGSDEERKLERAFHAGDQEAGARLAKRLLSSGNFTTHADLHRLKAVLTRLHPDAHDKLLGMNNSGFGSRSRRYIGAADDTYLDIQRRRNSSTHAIRKVPTEEDYAQAHGEQDIDGIEHNEHGPAWTSTHFNPDGGVSKRVEHYRVDGRWSRSDGGPTHVERTYYKNGRRREETFKHRTDKFNERGFSSNHNERGPAVVRRKYYTTGELSSEHHEHRRADQEPDHGQLWQERRSFKKDGSDASHVKIYHDGTDEGRHENQLDKTKKFR